MTSEQIFEICNNTILWTVIGAVLGASLGVLFSNLYNKRASRIILRTIKWEKCLNDGLTKDPNLMITVINESKVTLPLLNLHIMDFNGVNVKLAPQDNDLIEVKPGQVCMYRLQVLATENSLTPDAQSILNSKPKDFALRVYLDRTNKGPVHTDKRIANEIRISISELVDSGFIKKTLLDHLSDEEKQKIFEDIGKPNEN